MFVEAAPAKINLALHVVGRRPDRYHELESLVVFADVADELEAEAAPADALRVTGPFAMGLGSGETNLVARAVAAFRARWPGAVATGLAITLSKNLPVAAGLGGGSADAAAALRLLAGLSKIDIPVPELMALGAGLGADVPMCLVSRPAVVSGIGERVRPLARFPSCHVVLVNPLMPVATADVFRRLDGHVNPPLPSLAEPLDRPAQLGLWLEGTRNDLEAPAIALVPEIGVLIARMGQFPGCMLARMSGSGATVFGLFASGALAHQAAHDLRAAFPGYWVAAAPLLAA
ncbi:MAG TPA: 4-(cytidine 5'-diphospho)-2-C-methyl-D-erythritol kinase [Devosia sp.]|nr:4-(cytidine 5'-diphospho)-2-C-methyl-D-erythritol kinase [Devosia sp.]